jgi:hypothetical protein
LFKLGDHISVIRVSGNNYAFPVAPSYLLQEIQNSFVAKGHSSEIFSTSTTISELLTDKNKIDQLAKVEGYDIDIVLISNESFIARESKKMLEEFGVKAFLNESPKIFKDAFLLMDTKDGSVFATNVLEPCYQLIDQVNGYFKDDNLFSCELGDYPYRHK